MFNTDEMGHQDWEDHKEKTVYVSGDCAEDQVRFPVSRGGNRESEEEEETDIAAEQYLEQCQGMEISAIFDCKYSKDED
jgi:hypothetical protein